MLNFILQNNNITGTNSMHKGMADSDQSKSIDAAYERS